MCAFEIQQNIAFGLKIINVFILLAVSFFFVSITCSVVMLRYAHNESYIV